MKKNTPVSKTKKSAPKKKAAPQKKVVAKAKKSAPKKKAASSNNPFAKLSWVSMGMLADLLKVTKPAVLHHFKALKIKYRKMVMPNTGNKHKQVVVPVNSAKKVMERFGGITITRNAISLVELAKQLKKTMPALRYQCAKLDIPVSRSRNANKHSVLVIPREQAPKLRKAMS